MPSILLSLPTLTLLLITLTFTTANPTPTSPSPLPGSSDSDTTYSNATLVATEEVWNAQPSCYPIPEDIPSDFNCRDALDQFLQQYGNLQTEYTIARLPFSLGPSIRVPKVFTSGSCKFSVDLKTFAPRMKVNGEMLHWWARRLVGQCAYDAGNSAGGELDIDGAGLTPKPQRNHLIFKAELIGKAKPIDAADAVAATGTVTAGAAQETGDGGVGTAGSDEQPGINLVGSGTYSAVAAS